MSVIDFRQNTKQNSRLKFVGEVSDIYQRRDVNSELNQNRQKDIKVENVA